MRSGRRWSRTSRTTTRRQRAGTRARSRKRAGASGRRRIGVRQSGGKCWRRLWRTFRKARRAGSRCCRCSRSWSVRRARRSSATFRSNTLRSPRSRLGRRPSLCLQARETHWAPRRPLRRRPTASTTTPTTTTSSTRRSTTHTSGRWWRRAWNLVSSMCSSATGSPRSTLPFSGSTSIRLERSSTRWQGLRRAARKSSRA
mmetsp:Transcript_44787/g.91415  ORF Transcript_44787/g.91415 Transcript_44787/m.91415 type:complete len:200 (+) Transcript_44787:6307-6906(+)